MLFFNSPTLLLAGSLASALAQTGYGSNDTKPGSNDSLSNAPYSTCRFLAFVLKYTAAVTKVPFIFYSFMMYTFFWSFNKCQARQDESTGSQ